MVLGNKEYVDIITNKDLYYHETYMMGLVNDRDQADFHDGKIRVVDQKGKEADKYDPFDYLDHIAEASEPWSYEKFPYLKKPGYKGLVDGPESGIYRATPLSRMNVSKDLPTPLADERGSVGVGVGGGWWGGGGGGRRGGRGGGGGG